MPNRLPRRASSGGRLAALGAARGFAAGCWAIAALCAAAPVRAQDPGAQDAAAPATVVSPRGDAVALVYPRAEPATPDERRLETFGGRRINTRNNTPWPAPAIDRIVLVRLAGDAVHEILAPFETRLGWVRFAPGGGHLSWAVIRDTGVEQWVMEVATGIPRPLTSASLNATWGEPCAWLGDGLRVLCRFVVPARGTPPADPEARFDYFFTSQLATVELATGRRRDAGAPGRFTEMLLQDGDRVLVAGDGGTLHRVDLGALGVERLYPPRPR